MCNSVTCPSKVLEGDQQTASQKREKAFERSSLIRKSFSGERSIQIVSKAVMKKSANGSILAT